MNQVTIIGRLGRDPEIRAANNGKVKANITVAVNRRIVTNEGEVKEFTDWINMVYICTVAITHYGNLLYHEPYCSIICRQRRGTARFFKEVADI